MIELDGYFFNVEVERKNNKNMYLSLSGNTIKVRCPYTLTDKMIVDFIVAKKDWIIKIYKKSFESLSTINEHIYYLGKEYFCIYLNGSNKVKITDDTIYLYGKDFDSAVKHFYKHSENTLFLNLKEYDKEFYKILNDYGYHQIPEISFKYLKRSWGNCYPKKNKINLNYRLIHYPPICLKAVFLHECFHFILPNHSKRFHDLLNYYMPDYQKVIKILR